jgi:hypothetical protein
MILESSTSPLGSGAGEARRLSDECALLVMSCDGYSELWAPFFSLLKRHWPDCPFPVFLGAGIKSWNGDGVCTLKSSIEDRDWSGRLYEYLGQISQPNILMMLDDFFLRRHVSTDIVLECLSFAKSANAIQVCLIPFPGPSGRLDTSKIVGESAPGMPYRLNSQAAIWNRSVLRELLRPGESIWEFEQFGNIRALAYAHGFYAARQAVLPYQGLMGHHVIQRGRWFPHQKWYFGRMEIGCDFGARGSLPWSQTFKYHLIRVADRILDVFPWRTKAALKRVARRLLGPLRKKMGGMAD